MRVGRSVIVFTICAVVFSAVIAQTDTGVKEEKGYTIDRPGTITFRVGLRIKGKVAKPQVVIFLPKEKSVHRQVTFGRSFVKDIMRPLPFVPIVE